LMCRLRRERGSTLPPERFHLSGGKAARGGSGTGVRGSIPAPEGTQAGSGKKGQEQGRRSRSP
jgi:hypothetical protein